MLASVVSSNPPTGLGSAFGAWRQCLSTGRTTHANQTNIQLIRWRPRRGVKKADLKTNILPSQLFDPIGTNLTYFYGVIFLKKLTQSTFDPKVDPTINDSQQKRD